MPLSLYVSLMLFLRELKTNLRRLDGGAILRKNTNGFAAAQEFKMNGKLKKFHDRSGVTLVELLVVILIVTILAVTLLPTFQKYVREAQYAAEPIPLIGHIRTQIGLYYYENNDLPGQAGVVHTYNIANFGANEKARQYVSIRGGNALRGKDNSASVALADFTLANGVTVKAGEDFLGIMDMKADELSGNRMKPTHFQYVNLGSTGNSYAYAVGVFGDGNGLPKGTGYAVFEAKIASVINGNADTTPRTAGDPEDGVKVVGTWKDYGGRDTTQVIFHPTAGGSASQCLLNPAVIGQTTLANLNTALGAMTGWKFTN